MCGARFQGEEARRLGIAHEVFKDEKELVQLLGKTINLIKRCAPQANADTKDLMLRTPRMESDAAALHR